MSDGFETLDAALQGVGHKLHEATSLTFGKDVARALKGIVSGGTVVVLVQGATDKDVAEYNDMIGANTDKAVVIDARTHDYAKVRPNVKTFITSRKIGATLTPPRKNEEGDKISFLVRKNPA